MGGAPGLFFFFFFFIFSRIIIISSIGFDGLPENFFFELPDFFVPSLTTVFVFFNDFPFWIAANSPPPIFGFGPEDAADLDAAGAAPPLLKALISASENPAPFIFEHTAGMGICMFSILVNLAKRGSSRAAPPLVLGARALLGGGGAARDRLLGFGGAARDRPLGFGGGTDRLFGFAGGLALLVGFPGGGLRDTLRCGISEVSFPASSSSKGAFLDIFGGDIGLLSNDGGSGSSSCFLVGLLR